MESKPTIAVLGCGYVGLTAAAVLACCDFRVWAVEINPDRLKAIKSGQSFFYEAGLNNLLKVALKSGSLTATDSYAAAIPVSSIVFSCVGTPDNPDGSSNLNYVFEAARSAAKLLAPQSIFVQKSTVPVGTGAKIEQILAGKNKAIGYVSNPEFLREGTSISDSLWFGRVVAGAGDKLAAEKVMNIYRTTLKSRDQVAALAKISAPEVVPKVQYITTSLASAELIKVTANAFLALKISFANSIAKLADQAGADITQVMDGVGGDPRIGRAFLNAGRGYGGGCFPKDVSGLIRSAEDYGVAMEIMQAASQVNESMPDYILGRAAKLIGGSFDGLKVSVLGLSFKAGTS
ncbi:MAG: UDP-glucose dehydrogenase family protein, partial [Candidatus Saccharimonadales bacterium]